MKNPYDKKQTTRILGVVVIGIILGLLIVFSNPGKPTDNPEKPKQAEQSNTGNTNASDNEHLEKIVLSDAQATTAGISIETAGPGEISAVTTLTGEIHFNEDRTAHVVPRLGGVVESVRATLGQHVKKGQVLAVIASSALSEQRSEFFSAQKKLALAKTTFEREKKLWQDRIAAEQDYLQARQAMQEAEIVLHNAQQKLSALGTGATGSGTLNAYKLRAPFDGVIVEKHISLGESIKEDANIFTISDLSTVWAEIAVPANSIEAVRVGGKATVRAGSSDSRAAGTIAYVGSLLGEQTRTAPARIVLANPNASWRPGLFVSVDIVAAPLKAPLAVPADAIQTIDGKPIVFVRIKDRFEAHHVVLGKTDGKRTAILDGLNSGSPYAAKGSFVIKAELGKSSAGDAH